ncbi:VPLPA-CTERM sorting domain-containing protein [Jannaschia formosa]|nr:VPLPA-CTERM sorting domain-containing protein [Jannaschia formosa]
MSGTIFLDADSDGDISGTIPLPASALPLLAAPGGLAAIRRRF